MTQKRILFLHPDLGIGGAERAIVDAAIALKQSGYSVEILTNHHDTEHCFDETKNGLLKVKVSSDWFPRSIFGRFMAFCAYIRFFLATCSVIFNRDMADLYIMDQISFPIPILKLFNKKVLFYCHFPDKLLTTRESFLKLIYRTFIDYLEEFSLKFADSILVNSKFTSKIFKEAFPSLSSMSTPVLYPVPNVANLKLGTQKTSEGAKEELEQLGIDLKNKKLFLSINRYERKKNINLALNALHSLRSLIKFNAEYNFSNLKLVHFGGYDDRVKENIEHYIELENLVKKLNLDENVILLRNCSSELKCLLITACEAVIYTPKNEHFGIVPVEAMFLSRPVIALRSGGPMETISDGETGFLVSSDSDEKLIPSVANAMFEILINPNNQKKMSKAAFVRANQMFSFQAMKKELVKHVEAQLNVHEKEN